MENTKNLFKNAKVGDIVYGLTSSGFVKGKIVGINEKSEYPLSVMFDYPPPDNSLRLYNYDGEPFFEDYDVNLFWKPFDIPIREKKKVKKIITGYGVYDSDNKRFLTPLYDDKETAEVVNRQYYENDNFIVAKAKIKYKIEE